MNKLTGPDEKQLENGEPPISGTTPVRLGVFGGAFVFICTVVVAAAVYMTSSVSELKTEMRNMNTNLAALVLDSKNTSAELIRHKEDDSKMWSDLKAIVNGIERNGSQKALELEKSLNQLRVDFEVYKATQKNGKGTP